MGGHAAVPERDIREVAGAKVRITGNFVSSEKVHHVDNIIGQETMKGK